MCPSVLLLVHLCCYVPTCAVTCPPVLLLLLLLTHSCLSIPRVRSVALGQIVSGKHSKLSGMVSELGPPFPAFCLVLRSSPQAPHPRCLLLCPPHPFAHRPLVVPGQPTTVCTRRILTAPNSPLAPCDCRCRLFSHRLRPTSCSAASQCSRWRLSVRVWPE